MIKIPAGLNTPKGYWLIDWIKLNTLLIQIFADRTNGISLVQKFILEVRNAILGQPHPYFCRTDRCLAKSQSKNELGYHAH